MNTVTEAESGDAVILPYLDRKAVGAPGFYFTINATFRFIEERLGYAGLVRYWTALGRSYFKPVTDIWRSRGLEGVALYWETFFHAEPGAAVRVEKSDGKVVLHVDRCPLIGFLRENGREIFPRFCHHCFHVNTAIGEEAGITTRVCGGNGACRQEFMEGKSSYEQDTNAISLCQ